MGCGEPVGQRAGLAGLILAGIFAAGSAPAATCSPDRVTVLGDFGRAPFRVQVADDAQERAQGLMNVESMATMEGMLFVYPEPQATSFWMENTLIPLDMLFAGADGTITRIHENAEPMDRTPIPGGDAVQYVLEINGGLAGRLGIEEGDVLQTSEIGAGAAAPCE